MMKYKIEEILHELLGSIHVGLEQRAENLLNEIQMFFGEIEILIFGMFFLISLILMQKFFLVVLFLPTPFITSTNWETNFPEVLMY